jgi:large subunit ribosomal protein L4
VKLPEQLFSERSHDALVYETVRAEQLARRQGSASTRNRGQARGGGSKPWRQKGTGRARAGSIRAPHWSGGGVAFGPTPRSYTVKVNRKARRRALRAALAAHAERGSVWILDVSEFETPSTKTAAQALKKLDERANVLVLVGENEEDCWLSFRNLERATVLSARDAGVVDIVGAAHLVVSQAALDELAGVASEQPAREGKAA